MSLSLMVWNSLQVQNKKLVCWNSLSVSCWSDAPSHFSVCVLQRHSFIYLQDDHQNQEVIVYTFLPFNAQTLFKVANCACNALYRASSESYVAFSCPVRLVVSTLEQFLSFPDSCDLDTSENYTNSSVWSDVPRWLGSGLCVLGMSTAEVIPHSSC